MPIGGGRSTMDIKGLIIFKLLQVALQVIWAVDLLLEASTDVWIGFFQVLVDKAVLISCVFLVSMSFDFFDTW